MSCTALRRSSGWALGTPASGIGQRANRRWHPSVLFAARTRRRVGALGLTVLAAGVACAQTAEHSAAAPPASSAAVDLPAAHQAGDSHTRCVDGLGSSAVIGQLPWLESPAMRHATCRCAVGQDAPATGASQVNATATSATAAARILACAAQALRTDRPELGAHTALSRTLAGAIAPAAPDRMPFTPALMREGTRGCTRPEYPAAARRAGAQGTSVVSFRVSATGEVLDAVTLRSSGTTPAHKLLDLTAMLVGMGCSFTPATSAGQPVGAWATSAFVWKLE